MVRRDLIKFIGDSNIGICAFIMIWKAFGLFPITNDPDLFRRWLYGGIQDLTSQQWRTHVTYDQNDALGRLWRWVSHRPAESQQRKGVAGDPCGFACVVSGIYGCTRADECFALEPALFGSGARKRQRRFWAYKLRFLTF